MSKKNIHTEFDTAVRTKIEGHKVAGTDALWSDLEAGILQIDKKHFTRRSP